MAISFTDSLSFRQGSQLLLLQKCVSGEVLSNEFIHFLIFKGLLKWFVILSWFQWRNGRYILRPNYNYTLKNFWSCWYLEKPMYTLENHIGFLHKILVFCRACGIFMKIGFALGEFDFQQNHFTNKLHYLLSFQTKNVKPPIDWDAKYAYNYSWRPSWAQFGGGCGHHGYTFRANFASPVYRNVAWYAYAEGIGCGPDSQPYQLFISIHRRCLLLFLLIILYTSFTVEYSPLMSC